MQLLKPGGILSYIVSDTWRTIKSHRPLRRRLLDTTTVFHVLDLPSWIFDATVNTCILTLSKTPPSENHNLIAGDLRSIEKDNWKALSDNLLGISGHGVDVQTETYARYTYPQTLIATHENLSFFIGSPTLWKLMSSPAIVPLNEIAEVKYGIRTGDNRRFLYKSLGARGNYPIADLSMVLTSEEIFNLTREERLNGFLPERFQGKNLVPLDRGQAAEAEEGWLPNYSLVCEYFINWSRESVDAIKELQGMRNPHYYFKKGISFSWTGQYSPTYRKNSASVFDQSSSCIFLDNMTMECGLGILCGKFLKYAAKCLINHTVNSDIDTIKSLPVVRNLTDLAPLVSRLEALVLEIIRQQQNNPFYPYHLNEQKEIDSLVYQLYGLNEEDIREVELWYCRRYPKLAEAQGLMAEVKEKYAAHLERCRRILENPPSYWRSNPILQLIAEGESHTLEFKETLEYDVRENRQNRELNKATLKTIAAFLNAEGGTILIGVSDSGEVKGINRDLQYVRANSRDGFEQKLRSLINDRFDPSPLGFIDIGFAELIEGTVCRVNVRPANTIIHLDNEVYIRDGNGTRKLEGRALTDWIQQKSRLTK